MLKSVDNLSHNYVLLGFQNNRPVILKIGLNIQALESEAAALNKFANYSAVEILKKQAGVLLLAQALLGNSVKNIQVICQVMQKLHQALLPKNNFFPQLKENVAISMGYLEKARKIRNFFFRYCNAASIITWPFIENIELDTKFVADFFNFNVKQVRQIYFMHFIGIMKNTSQTKQFLHLCVRQQSYTPRIIQL